MEASSSPKIASICVFCGGKLGIGPEYQVAANRLGSILAREKIKLVYEGCTLG